MDSALGPKEQVHQWRGYKKNRHRNAVSTNLMKWPEYLDWFQELAAQRLFIAQNVSTRRHCQIYKPTNGRMWEESGNDPIHEMRHTMHVGMKQCISSGMGSDAQ